jgi:RNA polymerase sigma factor (TIGR02999 family)
MHEVTRILSAIEEGDPHAAEQLLPLVYDELRKLAAAKLAQEKPGQTLQPTALVHEAYVRLVGSDGGLRWNDRGHFFAAAAQAMRNILVDSARHKRREKHGGGRHRVSLDESMPAPPDDSDAVLALDEALSRLATEDPEAARIVQLRYYAGLSVEDAAQALGISRAYAYRQWTFARAWLLQALSDSEPA